jgi:hypothetical protein
MTAETFSRIRDGLADALSWVRGEIALPVTEFSSGTPITTVRHRGAPAKIGDRHAPQKKAPEVG